ncbi:hypothetical protein WDW37_03630 [Bdellovibrionota bacterium FG-1]
MTNSQTLSYQDQLTHSCLAHLAEQERSQPNRIPGVRTVVVVLSAAGIVFDIESLRQKILRSYLDSAVFFVTTQGQSIGAVHPPQVDLVIDLTGPGQRQSLLYAKRLARMARLTVGRNAGLLRKKIYDRVFDEKARNSELPKDGLERERVVQKAVLELAGVFFAPTGDTPLDRGKITPLELAPYTRL